MFTSIFHYSSFCKNHIGPQIGNVRVMYLSTVMVHDFAANRVEAGLSPRTVNSILVFLHSVLKYGTRQYRLPMADIVYLSAARKEMRVLSPEEEKKLVAFLLQDMDVYKLGVLLALYTGLRIGELCALRWEDFENDCIKIRGTMQRLQKEDRQGTAVIIVAPKTESSMRTIPLPVFLVAQMEVFRNGDQEYILGTDKLPVVEPRVMQYRFKRYLKQLNIENATFHTLRHTFATRCVEKSFDVKTLSEILGHSSVTVTLNLYVHSSLEFKRASMQKLQLAL